MNIQKLLLATVGSYLSFKLVQDINVYLQDAFPQNYDLIAIILIAMTIYAYISLSKSNEI